MKKLLFTSDGRHLLAWATLSAILLVIGTLRVHAQSDVTQPGDPIVPTSNNSPGSESVANAIDNQPTKYLNFDRLNTGFTVTPRVGLTVVSGLTLTSANDAPERDPASFTLAGSYDGSNFTAIASGAVPVFTNRFVQNTITFSNEVPYLSYRLIFPTVAGPGGNSMQIAEVELLGLGCELPSGPVDQTVCAGSDVLFCTMVTNANVMAYQWCKGTTVLPGQTNACLALFNVTPADAGQYCVKVTTTCHTVTNCARLSVQTAISATALTDRLGVCGQETVMFEPGVSGGRIYRGREFFSDFESGLPAGTTLYGNALIGDAGGNNVLRLTDVAIYVYGAILIPNPLGAANVDVLHAHWRSLVGGGSGADGYSFNWATDLPNPPSDGLHYEEGVGSGLSVTVDTFDNGDGSDIVGIEIKWQGSRVAFATVPKNDDGGGVFLRKNQFVEADVTVTPAGQVTFNYDGVVINATLPGFSGIAGGDFLLAARTGGFHDNHWIDDVRVVVEEPAFCPVAYSWLKNGSLLPGQTNASLVLSEVTLADAAQYQVVAVSCCNRVTNSVTLSVETTPPVIACSTNLMTAVAPGANTAIVNFTVTATDNCAGTPTALWMEDFTTSDGGFTVETPVPFSAPWNYNTNVGSWEVVQDGAEVGHAMTTRLTSPTLTLAQAGPVLLKFEHRYSFEADFWDGGQVQVSSNGGPFVTVPAAAFRTNGHNGSVRGDSNSDIRGQSAFVGDSPDHQAPAFITSIADLGSFNAGDRVAVRFLYAGDTNTRGQFVPNWEVTSIMLTRPADQGPAAVTCSPPSGSAFPAGVTTVGCVATDRAGNSNACAFTVTVDAGPACLLAWKFDEAAGLVALDSSGNTNLGRLTNGPVRTNGVVGRAIWFDGSNDRVQASNSTSLNVTSAFTVACWVRPESLSEYRYFLVKGNDANEKLAYGLRSYNSKLEYRWVSPAGIQSALRSTTNVLAVGRWTHVAAAHTPGSAPMLFVNGVAVPASVIEGSASNLIGTSPNPFCVGASADNVDKFKGTIDEVFVCLSKLTAGQIRNLTNGLPPGPVPPPPAVGIVTASPLPAGVIGAAYSTTLTATGGTPGFTWSILSNSLPAGLTLNTNTGMITGTPTAAGTNTFRVRVRDTAAQTSEKDFTLGIANRPACLVVYKFEEAAGPTALDSSGNGLHGTLLNGPIRTNGQVNRALRFDGSNDRVNGGNPSSLNHTGAITLAAWVRPESVSGTRMVIIKGELDDEDYAWALGSADAKLQYRWVNTSGDDSLYQSAPSVLAAGRWMHIAAVHTPGSTPRLYTNGVLVAGNITTGSGVANIGTTSKPFTVGSSSDGNDRFLGIIDEVFVCRGAWSTAGLSNLMAGLPPDFVPTATPVAPFPLPALSTATPFHITLRASGGVATLSWAALPGLSYRVQFKPGLEEKEWQDMPGDVYAFDEIVSIEDDISEQPQRFYRVMTIP